MTHIGINFHYVGMPAMPHEGIFGYSTEGFRECLADLARRFELLSLEDVLDATVSGGTLPEKACLITFDDGLKCQYEEALPVMDQLGAGGAFFASGIPYRYGKGLQVHKIHWVRARLGDEFILGVIEKMAGKGQVPSRPSDVDVRTAYICNPYDSPGAARLKYFLSYVLDPEKVDALLGILLEHAGMSEEDFLSFYYMSAGMIRDLAARKMLGSHAMSHRPLARMSAAEVFRELRESREILEGTAGTAVRAVSYPFGVADAVDRMVGDKAAEAGYAVGYTMEMAYNEGTEDPLLYARVDAKDIGKIPGLKARRQHVESPAG